jgi:16S rRNA (guanine527-N7)-methyltransferase
MTLSNYNVSRETLDDLGHYVDLIIKWNPKINLVSRSTLDDIWSRHIEDSLQVYYHARPNNCHWLDIGSGGGLPGLVIAILAKHDDQGVNVTLMESDQRKSVFLRTVIRELNLPAKVVTDRIELAEPVKADILSARALADLSILMVFSERHLSQDGYALLQKGKNWQSEVRAAQESWQFAFEVFKSITDEDAVVLKIGGISRA